MRLPGRRSLALIAGVLLALGTTMAVTAAGGNPIDKVLAGQDVVVPAGTTVDHDLYAFGTSVTIAGTVNGDLVAAGARVLITGAVTGDVFAVGSEITVAGSVGGDFRAGGAQVTVSGTVGEDIAAAASTLVLEASGRVGQDVLFTASGATLDGNVAGGITGSASDYRRQGTVAGTEDVTLAVRPDQPATDRTAALALEALRQYVIVLLVGLALLRFAPRLIRATVDRARTQPLPAAGGGVVALLGYVAALIALIVLMLIVALAFGPLDFGGVVAIDVVGTVIAIAGLTLGLIAFSAFVADAIVALAIGRLVALSDTGRWTEVIRLSIGAALVVVVTSFPEVGGVIKLLVILVALGAFTSTAWERRRRPAVPPHPLEPPGAPAAA
jgi:hypothetical protein